VPIGPEGERSQFFYGWVGCVDGVADWEGRRIEDSDVAPETVEDAGGFKSDEFGIGTFA
jgi:hypothetical protein